MYIYTYIQFSYINHQKFLKFLNSMFLCSRMQQYHSIEGKNMPSDLTYILQQKLVSKRNLKPFMSKWQVKASEPKL